MSLGFLFFLIFFSHWVVPEKIRIDGWDSGNSHGKGGQILWKSRWEGGLNFKKSSAGVILTDNSRNSNV